MHRFAKGRPLILGGVEIPGDMGLLGHSDADVIIHALMDGMLGALALGDIGDHFPDTDMRYKGISSVELLRHVVAFTMQNGFQVGNVDIMVLAEAPKLAPYKQEMINLLARELKVETTDVSLKATTMERLGAIGRREGIAAQAVVLMKPVQHDEALAK